jgi:hypothetical protein
MQQTNTTTSSASLPLRWHLACVGLALPLPRAKLTWPREGQVLVDFRVTQANSLDALPSIPEILVATVEAERDLGSWSVSAQSNPTSDFVILVLRPGRADHEVLAVAINLRSTAQDDAHDSVHWTQAD